MIHVGTILEMPMWSVFLLDACNLLNLETAAGLSDSCGIRAVSATKLQNLIWTRYSVLKTTTKHNQTILDNLNLWKHLSFIFSFFFHFFFLLNQLKWWSLFCILFFLHNNPFSDPLDHKKCRRRAYSRIIKFFFRCKK